MEQEEGEERQPQVKRPKAKSAFDIEVEHHIMPWLCQLIHKKLYVGPFLAKKIDVFYLVKELGITHIVNMCCTTDKVTEFDKLNVASKYTRYFDAKKEVDPYVVRVPVPGDFVTLNETRQIAFYIHAAKEIAAILKAKENHRVYVHNRSGFEHEAMAAILAWYMFHETSFPADKNAQAWLKQNMYERVLDNEEQQALLKKALLACEASKKGSMLSGWLIKK
jgi:hypothetical protein